MIVKSACCSAVASSSHAYHDVGMLISLPSVCVTRRRALSTTAAVARARVSGEVIEVLMPAPQRHFPTSVNVRVRRFGRRARFAYEWGSPLLCLAHRSSRGPAEILPPLPFKPFQSSESVRGDRPPSTVAMMAGQASSVDPKRARILLDGMSRREYPTAPSIQISVFSPGLRARGLGSHSPREKSISGISRSGSSIDEGIAFALRGAPCGDDSRPWAARGDYHDQQMAYVRQMASASGGADRGATGPTPLHPATPTRCPGRPR